MKHTYRPEIDGLRGIAVAGVVLYHAGLGVRGGFMGVDVFFVISGFLITQFIEERLREEKFSLAEFYERRSRRILPALLPLMVACSIASAALFTPSELKDFAESLVATVAFCSNVLFWKQGGYFAAPAHLKPLLHTWSLAIEEQFYILYPVLLLMLTAWLRRFRTMVLASAMAASFAVSVWSVHHFAVAGFFLLPTRAWELLLGALLALDAFPQSRSAMFRNVLSWTGLAGILGGIFFLGSGAGFPGWKAAFPCFGTAFLIYSNMPTKTIIGRLLSLRPILGTGLISYSLYLWHWPLLVFARHILFRPLTRLESGVIVLVSFAVAGLSWKVVEQPFRRPSGVFSRRQLFLASGSAGALLLAVGLTGYIAKGFPQRMPEQVARYDAGRLDINPDQQSCLLQMSAARISRGDLCVLGPKGHKPQFVIWGDSHADAMMPAFKAMAEETGVTGWFAASISCQPLLGVSRTYSLDDHQCADFNAAMLETIERNQVSTVVLVARWNVSVFGRTSYELENGLEQVFVVDDQSHESSLGENQQVFERGLRRTLSRLNPGRRQIYLVLDVPNTNIATPEFLAWEASAGKVGNRASIDASQYFDQQQFIRKLFEKVAKDYAVQIIDPAKTLCAGSECLIAADGRSLYEDDHHLSVFGALYLRNLFKPVFEQLSAHPLVTGLPRF